MGMDFGVKGSGFRSWLGPGAVYPTSDSQRQFFQAWQGPLNLPMWPEVMKSRALGVEIWALPAVRASEASDFKISFTFYPDANSNRQISLPFPLPKLLSKINTPRRQTIFILGH